MFASKVSLANDIHIAVESRKQDFNVNIKNTFT